MGPVIKVCELVTRRPDLDVEAFQRYWRDVHGPIVAAIPGLVRYVQSHPRLGGYRNGPLVYDGVAELWVQDKAALATMATTAQFVAAKADEPNFIDTTTLVELVVDEHTIKDSGTGKASGTGAEQSRLAQHAAIKSIGFVRFRADLAVAEAQRYWREVHAPLAAEIEVLRRYTQSHVRLGAYRDGRRPAWDGLAMTWFDSLEDMRASARTDGYRATIEDGPLLLASPVTPTILCHELVLVP